MVPIIWHKYKCSARFQYKLRLSMLGQDGSGKEQSDMTDNSKLDNERMWIITTIPVGRRVQFLQDVFIIMHSCMNTHLSHALCHVQGSYRAMNQNAQSRCEIRGTVCQPLYCSFFLIEERYRCLYELGFNSLHKVMECEDNDACNCSCQITRDIKKERKIY